MFCRGWEEILFSFKLLVTVGDKRTGDNSIQVESKTCAIAVMSGKAQNFNQDPGLQRASQ